MCPYCFRLPADTDDHIFPASVGGDRTVPSCASCNNGFGATFEAATVHSLLYPTLIRLRICGVPISDPGSVRWRKARRLPNGQIADLVLRKDAVEEVSPELIVRRSDENPKIYDVNLNDDPVGRRQFSRSFPPNKFRVLSHERTARGPGFETFKISLDRNPAFAALKMAYALASLEFPKAIPAFASCREALGQALQDTRCEPELSLLDLRQFDNLDALRPALAHLIYVEQNQDIIHAFVQFFGAFQFHVTLMSAASVKLDGAAIATLDILTGSSNYRRIDSLLLPRFAGGFHDALRPIRKMNAEAKSYGATTPPWDISILEICQQGRHINQCFTHQASSVGLKSPPWEP